MPPWQIILTVVGGVVAITGLIRVMLTDLKRELRGEISELKGEIKDVRGEVKDVRAAVYSLEIRFASFEGRYGRIPTNPPEAPAE